jgi:putative phosphotransacetylase
MSKVLIEVSARHVHLSKDDLDFLFGEGFNLEEEKKLSQGDDFASQSTVSLMNGERRIDKVRVLGPLRDKTQVEISRTDAYFLKLDAPLRISGDLEGAGSITIEGPVGRLDLKEGLIVAKRHLHCSP